MKDLSTKTEDRIKVLVLTGPTAVGKTSFAMHAAETFDGEIISCDSMQIYKGMDIGTAKPSKDELARFPHHLIDIIEPEESFSAAQYAKLARDAILDVSDRGRLPILCGGTGLYLDGVLYDMDYGKGPAVSHIRRKLEKRMEEEGPLALHKELGSLDEKAAEEIHPNNKKRLIRALERIYLGEDALKAFADKPAENSQIDPLLIGLERPREELYARINKRVDAMMDEGLLHEVRSLTDRGLDRDNISMLGIGYKELLAYLYGDIDLEEAIDRIKKGTRHYAKRQFTWFRRYDKMNWIDISTFDREEDALVRMDEIIKEWLRKR